MENSDYIIVSKKNKVFIAENDYFGFLESGSIYKEYKAGDYNGYTFDINYHGAVNRLHEWIKDYPECLDNHPKSKFIIYCIDGKFDKKGELVKTKVYTITSKFAKKYLIK